MNVAVRAVLLPIAALLLLPNRGSAALVSHTLGYIVMDLRSTQVPEASLMLRSLLSVTATFLNAAFADGTDSTFQTVSCSINAFQIGSAAGDGSNVKTANVTVVGQAIFLAGGNATQMNVADVTAAAFAQDGGFVAALTASTDPFLSNLTAATFTVNGATVASHGVSGSAAATASGPTVEVWIVALAGGAGAFVLVLCVVIACICCMKIDETDSKNIAAPPSQVANIETHSTSILHNEEDAESGSPSPIKSIGSQDSSIFTYNPKSVRSFDSRTHNSYFSNQTTPTNVEMDVAAWQSGPVANQHQISFGQDISAIELNKRDLSFIEEGSESSACSPLCNSPTASSGKYKSMLGGAGSLTGRDYLTEAAIHDMESAERARGGSSASSSSFHEKAPRIATRYGPIGLTSSEERDDDDDDNSSFYGPSCYDDYDEPSRTAAAASPRLNLSGSAANVMSDLHHLSSQIDQYRQQRPPPQA